MADKIYGNNRNARIKDCWLLILTIAIFCSCAKNSNVIASNSSVQNSADSTVSANNSGNLTKRIVSNEELSATPNNEQDNPLRKLLEEASWDSINEAKRQGRAAIPIIRPFLNHTNYQVRQMAVTSAGAIGDNDAADILASGIKDSNINVRLAAAKELSKQAYPNATDTILEVIKTSPDQTVREHLITAAGFLPGDKTVSVLRSLAKNAGSETDKNFIANNAIYALAKLKDSYGSKIVADRLSAKLPRTRYETLQNLCYVNDSGFVPRMKALLSDKAEAMRVGSVRNLQMRRVADAAVDSLTCLLKLELSFKPPKNLYTDEELNEVKNSVR